MLQLFTFECYICSSVFVKLYAYECSYREAVQNGINSVQYSVLLDGHTVRRVIGY